MKTQLIVAALLFVISPTAASADADAPSPLTCQIDPGTTDPGTDGWSITCPETGACGIVASPQCWTVRFACHHAEEPLQAVLGEGDCERQPDVPLARLANDEAPVFRAVEGALAVVADCTNHGIWVQVGESCVAGRDDSCDNYGINVQVLGDRCPGTACVNDGVTVAVLSQNCQSGPVDVCIKNNCLLSFGESQSSTGQRSDHDDNILPPLGVT